MTYASFSIDRRKEYYERAAPHIADDPLWFYCRANRGRHVQAQLNPKDLTLKKLMSLGKAKSNVVPFKEKANGKR